METNPMSHGLTAVLRTNTPFFHHFPAYYLGLGPTHSTIMSQLHKQGYYLNWTFSYKPPLQMRKTLWGGGEDQYTEVLNPQNLRVLSAWWASAQGGHGCDATSVHGCKPQISSQLTAPVAKGQLWWIDTAGEKNKRWEDKPIGDKVVWIHRTLKNSAVGKRADSWVGNNINSNKMELWVFRFFRRKGEVLECVLLLSEASQR